MRFKTSAAKEAAKPETTEPGESRPAGVARRPGRILVAGGAALGLVIAAAGAWFYAAHGGPEAPTELDSIFTAAYESGRAHDDYSGVPARPMPVCADAPFQNCIVDGDTFWLNGLEIRVANADAPGASPRCERESALSQGAIATLNLLLDDKPIEIRSLGRDGLGRLLALIRTPDGDVGRNLIRFDVAVRWDGRTEPSDDWCSG